MHQHSPTRSTLEAQALAALFSGFSEHNIRYAVLRNYEQLPHSVGARDIDIVVLPEQLIVAKTVVHHVAQTFNLAYANHFQDERLTQFALAYRLNASELFDLKIDFFTSSQVYGVEALSAIQMLTDIRLHNNIPVVSDNVLLLDKWLFHLLVGQPLHSKYDIEFAAIAQRESAKISAILTPLFGEIITHQLISKLSNAQGSTLTPLARRTRYNALWRMWQQQGSKALTKAIQFLAYRLRDRLRPHGILLSISGPDGCGKTTVIEQVLTQLRQIYGTDSVSYQHFRPAVLPRIAEVAKKAHAVNSVDEAYDRPHRAQPSGKLGSLIRLAYYWLDYLLGYLRRIRPALIRRQVVLFDRYFYDMICDPGRSRIALPTCVLRLVGRLLPLPHYAFFIQVEPDTIFARKQELSLNMIQQLNARYGDLVKRGWLTPIDNNGNPEQAAAAIVDFIIADQQRKHKKAFR